jgi:hypothetical protein
MDRPPEPPSRVESPTEDITLVVPAESTAPHAIPLPPTDVPSPPPRRFRSWIVALIAAALIAGAATAALVVSRDDGAGETRSAGTSSPSPSPMIPAPTGLTAEPDVVRVTLTWNQPPGGADVGTYNVYRDGAFTGSVRATSTEFADEEVRPGETYVYEVEGAAEGLVSRRASVTVKIEVPPLRTARLEGTFDVRVKTISQSGYTDTIEDFSMGWEFRPKCDEGACKVVWRDVSFRGLRAALKRQGATYSGADDARFIGGCGDVQGTSTVTLALRVKRAGVRSGEWRALRLVGTMKESHPAELGCVSGAATFSVTARLAQP